MSDQFGSAEFAVLVFMLTLSLVIGVYFTFCSRQDSYADYMLGGRNMGVLPVAVSQVASYISGMAIIGNPAEIYSYGNPFMVSVISDLVAPLAIITLVLPIFYNLKLNSLFEYLEHRFSHAARLLGSIIFTISQILYFPAYIFAPALVLNQVSGLPLHLVSPVICCVFVFYTTFGGLKAVLWSTTLQSLFALAAVTVAVTLGVVGLGGASQVYRINQDGGRVEFFNMELSPFVRTSMLSMLIGNTMNWCSFAVHPGAVQRCLSVSTLNKAKRVLLWASFGVFLVHFLTIYLGMVVYARYSGCDPVASGEINKTGQLVPLYMMELAKGHPGLAGLFVTGIFSAALSSMSSALNTMAGSVYMDVVENFFRGQKQSDVRESWVMKGISLALGGVVTALTLAVENTDVIFQLGTSLSRATNGALLTFFLLGIFVPQTNSKGAIVGSLSSLAAMSWITGNAYYYVSTGKLRYRAKHTSVDHCPGNISSDPLTQSRVETWRGYGTPLVADDVPLLYQVSPLYHPLLGAMVGVAVGVLVSLATRVSRESPASTDRRLYSPLVHHLLPPPTGTTAEAVKLLRVDAKEEEQTAKGVDKPESSHQN